MNRTRTIGLLLVATGIILNQLELNNDLADFLMGLFVALGAVLLIKSFFNRKVNER
ncbi:hypothetical protein [Winogradskyella haliclonae]|uniref:Uncharacterized protein n=1 Tax=Winogradskyella haliclonae TaxID=2048558 RepID=A0ABQ2BZS8_9FLAO|nr:hypothetical protein [Winogradskyella haliclonae]GGI56393.1 hypothetical protein GCM10011444_07020 [Winogradskyella haliclonae]